MTQTARRVLAETRTHMRGGTGGKNCGRALRIKNYDTRMWLGGH